LTTGITTDGGYAEFMVARMESLNFFPDDLDPVEAAPLLCAGRTTFGALKNSVAKGGDLVAIHGLGGLGHLGLQFAIKLGFETVVLSRGREKEALARKLGAHHFIDTNTSDAAKELMNLGGAKVILCTAPNGKAVSELVSGLSRDGQMIIVTYINEMMQLSPGNLLRGGLSIGGWVGGDPEDALRFSVLTGVRPMVEVFALEQAALAYERMMSAKVHFRAVLKIGGK
jgi:D-arabinose 1-dehydrogenase-like Zn-dependent alcohol dehydrogenase